MPYQNAPWLESQGKGKEKKKKTMSKGKIIHCLIYVFRP